MGTSFQWSDEQVNRPPKSYVALKTKQTTNYADYADYTDYANYANHREYAKLR
jgi:hypothetical protein